MCAVGVARTERASAVHAIKPGDFLPCENHQAYVQRPTPITSDTNDGCGDQHSTDYYRQNGKRFDHLKGRSNEMRRIAIAPAWTSAAKQRNHCKHCQRGEADPDEPNGKLLTRIWADLEHCRVRRSKLRAALNGVAPRTSRVIDCLMTMTVFSRKDSQAGSIGKRDLYGCPSLDRNGDAIVTVDEILAALSNAFNGCQGLLVEETGLR